MDPTLQPVQEATKLVADQGFPIVISGIVVLALSIAVYLAYKYFNRKLSAEYIAKDEVESWLKKHKPDLLKPSIDELPDLRNHRFFTEATKQMRLAEAAEHQAERDLATWTLRAYRDAFAELVESLYAEKIGFDLAVGDSTKFRARLDTVMTEANQAVKYRLVHEFNFPSAVYARWQHDRESSDQLMSSMLELASDKHTAYDRVAAALDSQYARVLSLRKAINGFVQTQSIEYQPPGESSHSTMQSIHIANGGYPAALFERRKR